MLLPNVVHPKNTIYYNGAIVLNILQEQPVQDLFALFQKVREYRKLSFPVYILCLDWLYLLNVAKLNNEGNVELCS